MSKRTAFIGDIHGDVGALSDILASLDREGVGEKVFLGDYINKGPSSREVIDTLLKLNEAPEVTLLTGNHETELLNALESRNLGPFLKMGGASTIRSYTEGPVSADVFSDFVEKIPRSHIQGLKSMASKWESSEVIASHEPIRNARGKFSVSAHVPVGLMPKIDKESAHIDTSSISGGNLGRLTAFLWPDCSVLQVDRTSI